MSERISINFVSSKVEVVQYEGGLSKGGTGGQILEKSLPQAESNMSRDEVKLSSRSLYDQLQDRKKEVEDAAMEKARHLELAGGHRGLEEDEIEFLAQQDDLAREAEVSAREQARRDRAVFEDALRAAAEARGAEEAERKRLALLGPAAASLLKPVGLSSGPFSRPAAGTAAGGVRSGATTQSNGAAASPTAAAGATSSTARAAGAGTALAGQKRPAESSTAGGSAAGSTGTAAAGAGQPEAKRAKTGGGPGNGGLVSAASLLGGPATTGLSGPGVGAGVGTKADQGSSGAGGLGLVAYDSDEDDE